MPLDDYAAHLERWFAIASPDLFAIKADDKGGQAMISLHWPPPAPDPYFTMLAWSREGDKWKLAYQKTMKPWCGDPREHDWPEGYPGWQLWERES